MRSERWAQIGDLYHAALERGPDGRDAFLREACGEDEALRNEVESLLAQAGNASTFLQASALELASQSLARMQTRLPVGHRLGHYEIQSVLGAGGMGEVYRARDTTLQRDVAIKRLPASIAGDGIARARLAREARILATLNHPNIAAIYGIVEADDALALVLELVDGPTLADCLDTLSTRDAFGIASQIADALEAAHEQGVIHRDLKPSNIKVARGRGVKVLDFGLAKLLVDDAARGDEDSASRTRSGVIAGTAAYMSPEQARGKSLDQRVDIWAFGCIVYELMSRRPAFDGETSSDTLVKVLESEPDWSALPADTPPAIRRLLRRALEKDASRRLHHIADARLEIADVLSGPQEAGKAVPQRSRERRMSWQGVAVATAIALAIAGVAYLLGRTTAVVAEPGSLTQLTFRQGTIGKARFAADGQTVIYSASWDGEPFRLFSTQVGTFQSRAVDLPAADLLALSRNGELAIVPSRPAVDGWEPHGTLAVTALAGGAPREMFDQVVGADWSPDGKTMAIARRVGSGARLEFPVGTVVHEANVVLPPRVSPDGTRVCFFGGQAYGVLMVAERGAPARVLARSLGRGGHCAWSPDGREIWVESAGGAQHTDIEAIDLSGRRRIVAGYTGVAYLEDIAADGKLLIASGTRRYSVHGSAGPGAPERDLSVFDASRVQYFSADGAHALLWDNSPAARGLLAFLRPLAASAAVALGPGPPIALTPDGRWAVVTGDGKSNQRIRNRMTWHPTGAGDAKTVDLPIEIEPPGASAVGRVDWNRRTYDFSTDGRRLLMPFGRADGRPARVFVYDIATGSVKPVTPEGVSGPAAISPDGARVAVSGAERLAIYDVDSGREDAAPGGAEPGHVARWTRDGRAVLVVEMQGSEGRVFRRDLQTGKRVLTREIRAQQPAGITTFDLWVSSDGAAYVYSAYRNLTNLYVVDGLR